MGLTLEELTTRVGELALHPTGAGRQTTKRIVRLTLAAIGEHFAELDRQGTFGEERAQALADLFDICQRAQASRRRAMDRSDACQQRGYRNVV